MAKKVHLSTRAKIVYILHLHAGNWLSMHDIRTKYRDRYQREIERKTVIHAIEENNYLNDNIQIQRERRYRSRRPIKVYSIAPVDPQTYLF